MTLRIIMLWMCLGMMAAFGLYTVKYKVQDIKAEVATAETQLREEKKNLHVLNAEWTYLNRPERLRRLSAKYLDIKPVHGAQLADLNALPANGIKLMQPAAGVGERLPPAKGMTLASGAAHAR